MIKTKKLSLLEKELDYSFIEKTLLKQALTHKSAHHYNNERLEFLGDAVLNLVIAAILYQHFPKATEGQLTRARASLVNKTTLAEIALALSLDQYVELGLGEKRSGGFHRRSILADTLEALLGAIYLDKDFETCYRVIQKQYQHRIAALSLEEQTKDPKTRLQEWLQANHQTLPKYTIIKMEGEPHAYQFTVICEVEAHSLKVEAVGASRRDAEQDAASKMLEQLKLK